jgi:hypothetical protein
MWRSIAFRALLVFVLVCLAIGGLTYQRVQSENKLLREQNALLKDMVALEHQYIERVALAGRTCDRVVLDLVEHLGLQEGNAIEVAQAIQSAGRKSTGGVGGGECESSDGTSQKSKRGSKPRRK